MHPGWEHKLWTHAQMREFVRETYPDFFPTYEAYPKDIMRKVVWLFRMFAHMRGTIALRVAVFVSGQDVFQYLLLKAEGGVELDLDIECLRPLDELIKNSLCTASRCTNETNHAHASSSSSSSSSDT